MRLIDGDALKERFEMLAYDDWNQGTGTTWARAFEESAEVVEDAPTIDAVEVVRCGKCRHYLGNHDVPGCAPCDFWGIGAVMWDDYCKRGERYDSD